MHLASSLRAVVVAALCLAPVAAHANPAWNAAKAHLPGDVALVFGVNVRELAKSSTVKMLLSLAGNDVKKPLEQLQRACNIDLWSTLQMVVVALDEKLDEGIVFASVKDLDPAKFGACVEALERDEGNKDAKVTVTTDGAITEFASAQGSHYLMWIGKDVIAMTTQDKVKTSLARWAPKRGAFAKSKLAKLGAKVNPKATAWAISTKPVEVDGGKISAAYGTVMLRGGNVDIEGKLGLGSTAAAKAQTEKLNAELASKTDAKALVDRMSLTAVKDEMVVKAKLTEGELLMAIGSLAP